MNPTTTLPGWATRLVESADLAAHDFLPIAAEDRDTAREQWLNVWAQVPFGDEFHAGCRARIERAVPLLRGPSRARTLSGSEDVMLAFFDPQHPDECSVSLSFAMPAPLAPRTGTDPASFVAGLASYLRTDPPASVRQPRAVRVVGEVQASIETIQRSMQAYELWLDDAFWGSASDDDPWADVDIGSAAAITRLQRAAMEQHPARFPSVATRTLWSQSTVRFERHLFGAGVFDLRYTPTDDPTPLRRFREEFIPLPVPDDMPVDAVASLLRASLLRADLLAQAFASGEASMMEVASLVVLSAGEPAATRTLQAWIAQHGGEEEMLAQAADVFRAYAMMSLCWEIHGRLGEGPARDRLGDWLMTPPGGNALPQEEMA